MKLSIASALLAIVPSLANAQREGIQCKLNLAGERHVINSMPGSRNLQYNSVLNFKDEPVNVSISIAETGIYMIHFFLENAQKPYKPLLISQGKADLISGDPEAFIFAAADHGVNEKARIAVKCE